MVGAAIPDCNRLDRVLPADTITALTALPWSWGITCRDGGALLIAFIITLLVGNDVRNPVFALRCVGIASHFVIDYFRWQPTCTTNRMRWPFLDLTVEYQGFYRSTDCCPTAVATIAAGIVLGIDRFVVDGQSRESEDVSPAD